MLNDFGGDCSTNDPKRLKLRKSGFLHFETHDWCCFCCSGWRRCDSEAFTESLHVQLEETSLYVRHIQTHNDRPFKAIRTSVKFGDAVDGYRRYHAIGRWQLWLLKLEFVNHRRSAGSRLSKSTQTDSHGFQQGSKVGNCFCFCYLEVNAEGLKIVGPSELRRHPSETTGITFFFLTIRSQRRFARKQPGCSQSSPCCSLQPAFHLPQSLMVGLLQLGHLKGRLLASRGKDKRWQLLEKIGGNLDSANLQAFTSSITDWLLRVCLVAR